MSEIIRLTWSVGLSKETDIEDNNDAEVHICSRNRQRKEAAKELNSNVAEDEIGVAHISIAKQSLGEIIDDRRRNASVGKKTYFDCNSWYKIDEELGRIRDFGPSRSTRNRRNLIDTLKCCYNFFGG